MGTSNTLLSDLNLEHFEIDQSLMLATNDGFDLDNFQQQPQNVISQNAFTWPSENLVHDQASQVASHGHNNSAVSLTPPANNSYGLFNNTPGQTLHNSFSNTPADNSHNSFPNNPTENFVHDQASQIINHSRANSSVSLTPSPADNSYGVFNNSPAQNAHTSFTTTPVADSLNTSNNSPAGNSPNSSNTSPAATSHNSFTNNPVESLQNSFSNSPAGNSPNSFNNSPAQNFSAGWVVEATNNSFGDLSASFSPASENHQNFVDLTDDNVAFGQGSQAANYGQIDPFASFASPVETPQQQVFNTAPEYQLNAHEHQAFANAAGAQPFQQSGSPHLPNTPSPSQQSPAPAPKKSAKKRASLPQSPAAKRPAKRARKNKAPANNEQLVDSVAVDNGHLLGDEAATADVDLNEYLLGAELDPQDYAYDLDDPLRTFSDSIPRNVPVNGNAPAPATNAISQDVPVDGNDTEQQAQLNHAANIEPNSPPKKRKRGNSTRTPNVGDAPAKKRKVSKKAKAKGRLSKSASSAKFGLGKGAGTGLNSPRTMYVFEDRAFYLIPAQVMPAFLEFVSTPRERPVPQQSFDAQQFAIEQQQQVFAQQQPFAQEQPVAQQQPFTQQQPGPVEQPAPVQEQFEPAYDIEGRLLTLLEDDEVNKQNNDDDPYAPAPRQPVPLSEAAIAFGLTSLSTEHSPSSSHNPSPAVNTPPPAVPSFTPSPAANDTVINASSDIVINPIPESSPRFISNNREIIARFNLTPTGSGTERDASHLEYFINLVHSSGLFACGHHDEIPGGFRWESWKTAEENLLALRPFFGTLTTKAWFDQWKKGENPVQLAEMEEDQ
ncbi:hypothetical protein N0V85_005322 [Neurospora sp. IMI 360204]|nr:hypothetical protein N0V85_005322 [Neurospora sp. IMI 360204]